MRPALSYVPRRTPLHDASAAAATVYLGSFAVLAFAYSNPIVLAGAGAGVVVAGLAAGAGRALRASARWGLTLGIFIVAVNGLVAQRGDTVLVHGLWLPLLGRDRRQRRGARRGRRAGASDPRRADGVRGPVRLRRSRSRAATAAAPRPPLGADRDSDRPAGAARRSRSRSARRGRRAPRPGRRPGRACGPGAAPRRRLARPRGRRRRHPRAAWLRAWTAGLGAWRSPLAPRWPFPGRRARHRRRWPRGARGRGGGVRPLSDREHRHRLADAGAGRLHSARRGAPVRDRGPRRRRRR